MRPELNEGIGSASSKKLVLSQPWNAHAAPGGLSGSAMTPCLIVSRCKSHHAHGEGEGPLTPGNVSPSPHAPHSPLTIAARGFVHHHHSPANSPHGGGHLPALPPTPGKASPEDRHLRRTRSIPVNNPSEALSALFAGHERFLSAACADNAGEVNHPHQKMGHLKTLCDTQKPFAAVLGCADSRVPPEILFDQGFGDLFVCRVAGNIASAEQVASLEYAVAHLKIKLIVVLGHAKCGACAAALADITGTSAHPLEGHLDVLVDHLAVAVERGRHHDHMHSGNLLDDVVKENVIYQVERLQRVPLVKKAVEAGQVKIVGGYYDLDTFRVSLV